MPEFTGSTDEKHVFTLPSEIDSVRTDRRQVAPRGKFGVKVATIFCADKSFIRLKLIDARGSVCDQISGRLIGDSVNVDLRVPPDAKGALMVRAEMPNHGLSADSEAMKIVEKTRVRGARWSQETVRRGDIVDLTANAWGAQDGRRACVRIFWRNDGYGPPEAVTRLRPHVENESVHVKYRFQFPGDTSDILPEWEAPEGYNQPKFTYTVEVNGITADSMDAKERGVMKFVDDIEFQLTDGEGAPREDVKSLTVKYPNGRERTAEPDENGVIRLRNVPPGPFKVVDYTLKEQSESEKRIA